MISDDNFPIENIQQLHKLVQDNKSYFQDIINPDNVLYSNTLITTLNTKLSTQAEEASLVQSQLNAKLSNQVAESAKLLDKIAKMDLEAAKLNKLEELVEKKHGVLPVDKGITDEFYVAMIAEQACEGRYTVDNGNGTKKMDCRLKHNSNNRVIGIECKNKAKITKDDIDKFVRDKVKHGFYKSVFVSTCPIPSKLEVINTVLNTDDTLWIYTKSNIFLLAVLKQFLSIIDLEKKTTVLETSMLYDTIVSTYTTWQSVKKSQKEHDKIIYKLLKINPDWLNHTRGHLFFVTDSQLKKGGNYLND